MVNGRPNIASVCRELPTPENPGGGLFVLRRLQAMEKKATLRLLQPVPFLPLVRPLPQWARANSHIVDGSEIVHAPMMYIPRFFKSLDGFWLYRSIYNQLAEEKRLDRLDAIDAHFGYPDGVGCLRAGRRLGIPVFVTVRGVEVDYLRSSTIGKQLRRSLSESDGCICVSHSLKRTLSDAGVNTDRTRVIHNAVDRDFFRPQSKSGARHQLQVPPSQPLIVSVGNLLSVKRHDVLIEAFAKIRKGIPGARLVIVGGARHEPLRPAALKNLCEALGVQGSVSFVGKLAPAEVLTWLAAADVFALASEREGCSNALLEALACGIPSVVTAVGDNSCFVTPGENGYLVPVDDSDAFCKSLTAALGRKDWDRDRISSGLQVGNWDTVASKVLEFMTEQMEYRNGVIA